MCTAFYCFLGHLGAFVPSLVYFSEHPWRAAIDDMSNLVFTDDSLMNIAIVKSNIPHLLVSLLQDKSLDVVWDCTEIFAKLGMHSKSPLWLICTVAKIHV
jgi:hypothetical protein